MISLDTSKNPEAVTANTVAADMVVKSDPRSLAAAPSPTLATMPATLTATTLAPQPFPMAHEASVPLAGLDIALDSLQVVALEGILHCFGRKAALGVLQQLLRKGQRFCELEQALNISPRTLTERLKELQQCGLIHRQAFAEVPPRVEYNLTNKGTALLELLSELLVWAEQHEIPSALAHPSKHSQHANL
jgi:DNA-binding HxlR family transcriptional regulator